MVQIEDAGCSATSRVWKAMFCPLWRAAHREAPDLTEDETHDALHRLDPLWEQLFPAERARIVRSLVERVVVGPVGADIRLRLDGLGGLVRDLGAIAPDALRAAA